MKRIFALSLLLGALAVSCEQYDDSGIKESLSQLQDRVTALESLRGDVASLKDMVEGLVTVISCEEKDGAYTLVLSDGKKVIIPAESKSEELTIPVVTFVEEGGVKYWGYYADGKVQTLTDNGKPVAVSGNSAAPQFRVDADDCLAISIDGGKTWTKTDAKITSSLFSKLEKEDDCFVLTLADGYSQVLVPLYKDGDLQFVAFSGKKFFAYGETKSVTIGMVGIENFTVTEKPDGWKTVLTEGQLQVTAPAEGVGEEAGVIKMLGIGREPKIAQINVTIGTTPVNITISASKNVTIAPVGGTTCFYGACLLSDFDPKTIAKDLGTITNPNLSRQPSISSKNTWMLSDMVEEVIEGETYVVWALPLSGEGAVESDVLFEAVSSIGINYNVSDVTFEDAKITASVKGADKYYLVPLGESVTVENCIEDLQGSYAYTYDRYLHDSSFRGYLSDLVEKPISGNEYSFAIIPVLFGNPCSSDAETFKVTLKGFSKGGNSSVTIEETEKDYKTMSFMVTAQNAYKCFVATVSETDYLANGYANDDKVYAYLSSLSGTTYKDPYTYKATNLESGTNYYVIAVAIDRNGAMGTIVRKAATTKAVEYSSITLTVGEVAASYASATVPVTASGDIVKYRYMFLSGVGSDYWYFQYVDNDKAAEDALIYGSVEYTEVTAATAASGIVFNNLSYGVNYIFRVVGYDKDGKVTHVAKADVTPTVGAVIRFTDARWEASKPTVTASKMGTSLQLNINFPKDFVQYVITKMSSEEYSASMPSAARLRTDYVLSHGYAEILYENKNRYMPADWYIGGDMPYVLVTWQDAEGWYEPLVIDSATGEILNK